MLEIKNIGRRLENWKDQ